MKHTGFVLISLFSLLLVVGASAQADVCEEKGGTGDPCTITETTDTYEITVTYPAAFVSEYPFTETAIDDFLTTVQENFKTAAAEVDTDLAPGPLTQIITFTEYPYSDDLVGIRFIVSEYLGGANPNAFVRTFTFDVEDEEPVTLDDLFRPGTNYLERLSTLAEADLREQFGDAVFVDGLAPTEENFANFNLTDNALLFTFNEYQAAPGAAGTPEVEIPLFRLSDILVSGIIQYRKG